MKIRELKRTAGQTVLHAWPPMWTGSYTAGDKFAVGEVGTLKSVKSRGDRLILTIEHEAREASGPLQWDAPPTVAAVEKVLGSQVGKAIKDIGGVEIADEPWKGLGPEYGKPGF
jgi:hypothetical protein